MGSVRAVVYSGIVHAIASPSRLSPREMNPRIGCCPDDNLYCRRARRLRVWARWIWRDVVGQDEAESEAHGDARLL